MFRLSFILFIVAQLRNRTVSGSESVPTSGPTSGPAAALYVTVFRPAPNPLRTSSVLGGSGSGSADPDPVRWIRTPQRVLVPAGSDEEEEKQNPLPSSSLHLPQRNPVTSRQGPVASVTCDAAVGGACGTTCPV